jgi:hypothetical protein
MRKIKWDKELGKKYRINDWDVQLIDVVRVGDVEFLYVCQVGDLLNKFYINIRHIVWFKEYEQSI